MSGPLGGIFLDSHCRVDSAVLMMLMLWDFSLTTEFFVSLH